MKYKLIITALLIIVVIAFCYPVIQMWFQYNGINIKTDKEAHLQANGFALSDPRISDMRINYKEYIGLLIGARVQVVVYFDKSLVSKTMKVNIGNTVLYNGSRSNLR